MEENDKNKQNEVCQYEARISVVSQVRKFKLGRFQHAQIVTSRKEKGAKSC